MTKKVVVCVVSFFVLLGSVLIGVNPAYAGTLDANVANAALYPIYTVNGGNFSFSGPQGCTNFSIIDEAVGDLEFHPTLWSVMASYKAIGKERTLNQARYITNAVRSGYLPSGTPYYVLLEGRDEATCFSFGQKDYEWMMANMK